MSIETRLDRAERNVGLLERHSASRQPQDFTSYADRPVEFIREQLRWEPWAAQVRIAESVLANPRTVVRSANSIGKDAVASRLAVWWTFARRGQVLVTGPTERQVKGVVFGQIRQAFAANDELPGELFEQELRVDRVQQIGIQGLTSTEASRLTGFHAPRTLVILTEAQAVEDFAWEAMFSCATGEHDRILAVGNPLNPTGRFYTVSRSPAWHSIRISAFDHPNVIEGRTVIPGGITRQFVETIEREYGKSSPIYQSRVLAEFPSQGEDALISRDALERAAERWEAACA